jgi:hypothetical protein
MPQRHRGHGEETNNDEDDGDDEKVGEKRRNYVKEMILDCKAIPILRMHCTIFYEVPLSVLIVLIVVGSAFFFRSLRRRSLS